MTIAEFSKEKKARTEKAAQAPQASGSQQNPAEGGQATSSNPENGTAGKHFTFASAVGYLAILGLASPFLELGSSPLNGLIGLVILFVGIRIAWQLTRGHPPLVVDGPF